MDRQEAKRIIEAVLFVSDKPVSIMTLKDVLKEIEPTEIRECIEELNREYDSSQRSFSIKEIAGGFQMLTDPIYSTWITSLYKRPPDRMTGPALETLAIIAYKQPLTRSDIEVIRGVNVDGVLHTLEERGLIKTRGRVDGPGRPILYGTTSEFLQHFGLKSLEDLPKLKEFQESDLDFVKEQQKSQAIDTQTGELKVVDKSDENTAVGLEPAATAEKENKDGTEELEKSN